MTALFIKATHTTLPTTVPTLNQTHYQTPNCDYKVNALIPPQGIQTNQNSVTLFDRGILYVYLCNPGQLSFTATAKHPPDMAPTMTAAWQTQTLWSGEIRHRNQFTFHIPAPGWFTLSLSDRYYNPPNMQSLTIQNPQFTNQHSNTPPQIINLAGE